MGAGRVEITQNAELPGGIAAVQIAQDLLNHQLRAAIGIGGGELVVFSKRQPDRIAIHGG